MSAGGLFVTAMVLVILWLIRRWDLERETWARAAEARQDAMLTLISAHRLQTIERAKRIHLNDL